MNICIIEDDPATRMLLRALVNSGQTTKHHILECLSGEDALAKLSSDANPGIDIYLVDLTLPGISGLEVMQHIRESYSGGSEYSPYIMMVTAHEAGEALEPALIAGANDYLTKPVNAKVLQTRLKVAQRLIEQSQIQAQSEYAKAILAYTGGQLLCPMAVVETTHPTVPLKVELANTLLLSLLSEVEQQSLAAVMQWPDALTREVLTALHAGHPFHGALQSAHPAFQDRAYMIHAYPSGSTSYDHALVILEASS